jgi:hypothetical protein
MGRLLVEAGASASLEQSEGSSTFCRRGMRALVRTGLCPLCDWEEGSHGCLTGSRFRRQAAFAGDAARLPLRARDPLATSLPARSRPAWRHPQAVSKPSRKARLPSLRRTIRRIGLLDRTAVFDDDEALHAQIGTVLAHVMTRPPSPPGPARDEMLARVTAATAVGA